MSILSRIFGETKASNTRELEDRVALLEATVRQMSEVLRDLASLSVQTGLELEEIVEQLSPKKYSAPKKVEDSFH